MKEDGSSEASSRIRPRCATDALAFAGSLAALLALWACNVEGPSGKRTRHLRFDAIGDSLAQAGYDRIEITMTGGGLSAPLAIYQGAPSPVTPKLLPESLGDAYQVTVKAFDDQKPGLVFQKLYAVAGGKAVEGGIHIVPDTVPEEPVPGDSLPAGVSIAPTALALAEGGDSSRLKASVRPAKAKQDVMWKTGDAAVATVDADGLVRSVGIGKTRITAQAAADPSKQSAIEVTVSKPPVTVEGVDLDSARLRLFVGGPAATLNASIRPNTAPRLLNWESSDAAVAAVNAEGTVTGLSAGTATIKVHYKSDKTKEAACQVTVVKDVPVLTVGEAVSVEAGATVAFAPKVTQEFGGIVEFKWSLDGDTVWDETATAVPAGLSRKYTAAGDVYAYFSVKDGEGNVAEAKRLIRVGSAAPLVVIDSPRNGDTVATTPITVSYKVNNVSKSKSIPLVEGRNRIGADTVVSGARGFDSITVVLDTRPPEVRITNHGDGLFTNKIILDIAWMVDGKAQTTRLKDTLKAEGRNIVRRESIDARGLKGSDSIAVILDTKPPVVKILSPVPGAVITSISVPVVWAVDGVSQTFQTTEIVSSEDGPKTIARPFKDNAGNEGKDSVVVVMDAVKPKMPAMNAEGTTPSPTNARNVTWKWTSGGVGGNAIFRYWLDSPTVPPDPITPPAQAAVLNVSEGSHTLYVQESDAQGNWSPAGTHTILVDRTGPSIVFDGGARTVTESRFEVSAQVNDPRMVANEVRITGGDAVNASMFWGDTGPMYVVFLKPGPNTLTITAQDFLGNVSTGSVVITYREPAVPDSDPP